MIKQMADASGPTVTVLYFLNHFIIPTVQPILVSFGLIASLVWYAIRFYDRYRYGPNFDDDD